MKKQEYLDLLRYYLRAMPKSIIEDIILDYEEHFRLGLETGKTEEKICEELGSPELIAKQFIEYELRQDSDFKVTKKKNKFLTALLLVVGLILFSPVIMTLLGILMGIFGMVMGVIGGTIGLIVFAIVIVLGKIPFISLSANIAIPIFIKNLHPITTICLSVAALSFSILIFTLILSFIKWFLEALKKIILTLKWKIEKRFNEYE